MTETKTASPTPGVTDQSATAQSGQSPRNDFMVAVLGMSWQLAVVVLVPIVGGFELDKAFATSPLLVIFGFIVALTGFMLIVKRQMQIFTPLENQTVHPEKPAKTEKPQKKEPTA
jgi:F0F1-type ATP synthase assembly protein I